MKKHLYCISAIFVSSVMIEAQTLTQAANAPAPGNVDSRKEADTTSVLPNSTTGSGVTWNFTNAVVTNLSSFTNNWVNPSTLPGTSLFTSAGANVALSDSTQFMKSSSTKLEYLGDMFSDGSITQLTNTAETMHFPFSYGNNYTDNFSGYSNSPGFGNFNITGSITVTADGQGTLILPTNPTPTSYTVLRVKSIINMNIAGTGTLSFVTGTLRSINYQYFKTGTKFPILNYEYQTVNIPALGINNEKGFFMHHDASITLNVNSLSNNNSPFIFIFPNPSSQYLNIHSNTINTYKIEVFNINGQCIYKDVLNSNQHTIETEFWSNGIYIIQFTDEKNNKNFVSKFIKE